MRMHVLAAAAVLSLASVGVANASVSLVTSEGALGATDSIDWGQLGGDFTVVAPPVNVLTGLGDTVTVSSGGELMRMGQGSTWAGNFSNGERLLWTEGNGPDITLTFANAVSGVGAQIQADFYGGFTAEVIGNGGVLGTFTENGNSNGNGDGSAIFIGFLSSSANITSIRFDITNASNAPNDFAIGHVAINGNGGVPEPASWALMVLGFGAAGAAMRKRRSVVAAA